MKIMEKENVKKLIFCSSSAVYGRQKIDIREDFSTEILSPYASTKSIGEKIIQNICTSDTFQAIILRIFNPVGVISDFSYEMFQSGLSSTVLAKFINGIKSEGIIDIYGMHYKTPDGSSIRDFIHIEDLLRAIILSLNLVLRSTTMNSKIINIGSGKGTSLIELSKRIGNILNVEYKVRELPNRKNDVFYSVATISKANKLLNWVPKHYLANAIQSMVR